MSGLFRTPSANAGRLCIRHPQALFAPWGDERISSGGYGTAVGSVSADGDATKIRGFCNAMPALRCKVKQRERQARSLPSSGADYDKACGPLYKNVREPVVNCTKSWYNVERARFVKPAYRSHKGKGDMNLGS
jgi:hypothetical protein